jgi:glycosyltransferase involved in cell wall biosynthesis
MFLTTFPLISIIVPCYNQGKYLNECLESVLMQDYKKWECIIVNDGSIDNTSALAAAWKKRDNRFKYIEQVNGGLSSARNTGINFSIGDLILPLDADDKITKNYIDEAVRLFTTLPNLKLVYCKAHLFGNEDLEWKLSSYTYKNLLIENMIFCSSIYKKTDFLRIKGYDEELKNGLEDWDFWIRLLDSDALVMQLPIIGFYYRIRNSSMHKKLLASGQLFNSLKTKIFVKNIIIYEQNFSQIHSILREYGYLKKFEQKIKYTFLYRTYSLLKSSFPK